LLSLVGEVGTDLACWKSEKHFTEWCGLPPGSKQAANAGGKYGAATQPGGAVVLRDGAQCGQSLGGVTLSANHAVS